MVIEPHEFPAGFISSLPLQKRKRGNQGNKRHQYYKDIITAFDIETSHLPDTEHSFMYIWQWQFGSQYTVIGRTWQEFLDLCDRITDELPENQYICVFVHNLSYEFSYLCGVYPFLQDEVFAVDSHKVLKCTMYSHLELRCSYLHSNLSLKEYLKKMGVEHQKLDGAEFDYSEVRYPWTELTDRQLEYCINDVLGLVEAVTIDMAIYADTLYTFPLTSTGYVRREAKKVMKQVSYTLVHNQLADYRLYRMLREAFRGGNTHANRLYAGDIVTDVTSMDRSSSYPDVLCNCMFPMSRFTFRESVPIDELKRLIFTRGKAVIFRASFTGLRLKDPNWGCPYLTVAKSRNAVNVTNDNGRIIDADYLECTLTDIDYKIICDEYECDDMTSYEVAYARYGKLPEQLIKLVQSYYINKQKLKGDASQQLYYDKQKAMLNSIYGMMVQDPIKFDIHFRQSIDYSTGEAFGPADFHLDKEDPEQMLTKHNRSAFLCYQWGVWCTAWARYRLEQGLKIAGDDFIYCDTDSVKYIGNHTAEFEELNKHLKSDSEKSGSWAVDSTGKKHWMGEYEHDGQYEKFVTLGAKKYCYVAYEFDKKKQAWEHKLHVTVSGVGKQAGAEELTEHGGIDAFRTGFVFRKAGGTMITYNVMETPLEFQIDDHTLLVGSNANISDSTYTLGVDRTYAELISLAFKYRRYMIDRELDSDELFIDTQDKL